MKVTTSVKAGGFRMNRCEFLQRKGIAIVVKTNVKAGCKLGVHSNRCETLQRKAMALVVKTGVKAGGLRPNRCENMQRKAIAK